MAAKSRTMAQQKTKEAYCFIVPAFIYMILVLGYPIVYNIILSLKDVNVKNLKSGTSVFVGLQNYIDLFHDPTFLLVLRNTFIFTIACLATVYKGNIIKNLIMDCQSYTKYRPNETTGGIFVSWRRKEELPTGA